MGLDAPSLKFLFAAKQRGVDFSNSIMIGRQSLRLNRDILGEVFHALSIDLEADSFLDKAAGYGEIFFQLLGAKQISSIDASSYEHATYVHDLNSPIDDSMKDRFTVVHDGGTLEHIFNFPQAIKNCMEMVCVGGHFIQVSIANNFMGHGFYQLSPELIYRVFSEENGFSLVGVFLHEVIQGGRWYRVMDPKIVRQRVELSNQHPTYVCTLARKTSHTNIFGTVPQQSDYSSLWEHGKISRPPLSNNSVPGRMSKNFKRMIPSALKRAIKSAVGAAAPPEFAQSCYREIKETDLIHGRME